MICALCKKNEADKTNTHYLSDGIIRSCLNQDGLGSSKNREKGFYFDISNNSAFVEFNFQRNTSVAKLEQALGREITEDEIEKAKQIPFSVNYVFCTSCENKFTEIETSFINTDLPKLRQGNLDDTEQLELSNVREIRFFMLLQVWRTAICEDIFKIDEIALESLRLLIFNHKTASIEAINEFPLSVTYLRTEGGQKEFTSNYVGVTSDVNPNIVFMNDFIIQFFDKAESVQYLDFYGLNSESDYKYYLNIENPENFRIRIVSNTARKELLSKIINSEKVQQTIEFYKDSFNKLWFHLFGSTPSSHLRQEYITTIIGTDEYDVLKLSKERIVELTSLFVEKKISNF